ncbi:MAG: DUF1028 domain-containing protein [Mesorhizobium sp.]|nr:MAG: DUF1028 domain-containing protein [Mesorhizobium sp.]
MTFSIVARCSRTGMFGVAVSSSSPAVAARCAYAQAGVGAVYRQVLAVDVTGTTAIHSGPKALGIWAEARADNAACGGNMLAHDGVPQAMVEAFLVSEGHLGDRLIATMRAALKAGGEVGPVHSAGMKLVREVAWPVADLRCDWTDDCPIEQLASLWEIYKPQLDAYVTRAINPSDAPSYGVPGDE